MKTARNGRINKLLKKEAKGLGLTYSEWGINEGVNSKGEVFILENPNKGVGNHIHKPFAKNFYESVPYLQKA